MIDRQVSIIVSSTGWEALKKRQAAEGWVTSSAASFRRKSIQGCSLVAAVGQGSAALLVYFTDYVRV